MRVFSSLVFSASALRYLLIIVISHSFAGCARAQTVDLATDESVIIELQKAIDAKNAERANGDEKLLAKQKAASRLGKDSVCIERLEASKRIIVIGFFRYDYGCHFEGAFIDSHFYESETKALELSKAALEALGWQKANRSRREELARIWVEKGLLAFFAVLYADKENLLRNQGFQPPAAVTTEKGNVKVTVWVQVPPGRNGGKGFQCFEFEFDSAGSLSSSRTLAAVQI